jgi:hypothetical protein
VDLDIVEELTLTRGERYKSGGYHVKEKTRKVIQKELK